MEPSLASARRGPGLTHVVEDAVALQLRVFDFALQHHQLLLVLLFERVQAPLAVLQLIDQLLLDRDLTGDVGQICLEVLWNTDDQNMLTRGKDPILGILIRDHFVCKKF